MTKVLFKDIIPRCGLASPLQSDPWACFHHRNNIDSTQSSRHKLETSLSMEAPTYKKGRNDGLRPEENSPQAVPGNALKKERLPVAALRSGLGLSPCETTYEGHSWLLRVEREAFRGAGKLRLDNGM